MRYNPCGRVCDIGREGYTQTTRVFRDSEETAEVIWYPARDDAPVLDCPSAILNDVWEADRADDQGQVLVPDTYWSNERNFEPQKLTALGLHQCGTAEDFAEGCVYDPDAPPVEYRTNGLPVCCPPIIEGRTQGRGGMNATVTYQGFIPSATCADAPVMERGRVYSVRGSTDLQNFFKLPPLEPAEDGWTLTISNWVGPPLYFLLVFRGTCDDSTLYTGGVYTEPLRVDRSGPSQFYFWIANGSPPSPMSYDLTAVTF